MAQAATNTIRIPVVSDESILILFDRLVRAFPPSEFDLHAPARHLGKWNNRDALNATFPNRDWSATRLISSGTARLFNQNNQSMAVHFHRYVISQGNVQQASLWENEIWIEMSGDIPPPNLLKVLDVVDQFQRSHVGNVSAPVGPSTEVRDLLSNQISKLAELQANIVSEAEQARLAGEARLAAKFEAIEQEAAERRSRFEAEIETVRSQIAEAEESLAQRKKTLDDRDHMHVRRGLRADITNAMQQRMAAPPVSKQTGRLRSSIVMYSVVGILGLLGVSIFGAWDTHALSQRPDVSIWALVYSTVRFVAPLAVATGLLIYLLNWLRRIHAEDVRSERDLERYRFDIDRASWAFETIQEAQSKEGGRVPETWIEGATQGLFARSEQGDEDGQARDALAALLGYSAKAQIGTDGARIEIGRDGLRRLSRDGA
jgi:hypothetical protein